MAQTDLTAAISDPGLSCGAQSARRTNRGAHGFWLEARAARLPPPVPRDQAVRGTANRSSSEGFSAQPAASHPAGAFQMGSWVFKDGTTMLGRFDAAPPSSSASGGSGAAPAPQRHGVVRDPGACATAPDALE